VPRPGEEYEVARTQSHFDPELVFAACAQFDTAVEINCRPERQDPPDELLTQALEWGCRVAIDTDAHATGQLEWQVYGCDKAARHEIDVDRIVNTMPADELVEWAATNGSR
jgi:putative hydrolase